MPEPFKGRINVDIRLREGRGRSSRGTAVPVRTVLTDHLSLRGMTPATRKAVVDFVERVTDEGGARLRPAGRADRGVRQRRHALVREADADRARLHPACGWPRWPRPTSRCASEQPWKAAREKDYAWLGAVITKHYHGDDSDVKVLMRGMLQAFAGHERRATTRARPTRSCAAASTRPSAARSTSAATCR